MDCIFCKIAEGAAQRVGCGDEGLTFYHVGGTDFFVGVGREVL